MGASVFEGAHFVVLKGNQRKTQNFGVSQKKTHPYECVLFEFAPLLGGFTERPKGTDYFGVGGPGPFHGHQNSVESHVHQRYL